MGFRCKSCGEVWDFFDKEKRLENLKEELAKYKKTSSGKFDYVAWIQLLIESTEEDLCPSCYVKRQDDPKYPKLLREWNRLTLKDQKHSSKQRLKGWAQEFIGFITEGPDFDKLRQNGFDISPETEKHFLDRLREISEILKQVIIDYEDFLRAKQGSFAHTEKVERARQKLRESLSRLNDIPTCYVRYSLLLEDVTDTLNTHQTGEYLHPETVKFYVCRPDNDGDSALAYKAVMGVENFKRLLKELGEHFPIGVCRYEKCRKFFVKERKDERYCSAPHKNADWVKQHRTKTSKYKSWRRR